MGKIKERLIGMFEDKQKSKEVKEMPRILKEEQVQELNHEQQSQVVMVTEQQLILDRLNYLTATMQQVLQTLESFKVKGEKKE